MTTARSIVCGSCGSDVPTGRLSCPACGDLLASVAGGSRRAMVADVMPASDIARSAEAIGGERVPPSILHDAIDDLAAATPAGPVDGTADRDGLSALAPDAPPAWDAATNWDEVPAQPGAWVPPRAPIAQVPMPAGIAAPARAWAGHTGENDALDRDGATAAAPRALAAAPGRHDAGDGAGEPAALAASVERVDGARVAEFIGWLAIAGGALAAVGFLLPWGSSMIGATGTDYLSRWGIAGPFHLLVALASVAIVLLAVVPNPVPAWIRVGIAGTMLAMFLLGLAWPYVFGFSSTGPGALAVAVGATVLLAAGIICLVTDRHRAGGPAV